MLKVNRQSPNPLRALPCLLLSALLVSASLPAEGAPPTRRRAGTVQGRGAGTPTQTPAKPAVKRSRIEVPCRAWVPKDKMPKTLLVCVHGLGLNSASYEDFGKRMSSLGVGTFAVDVRGFGTWMQVQGKEQVDFDACIEDVKKAINVLHEAYPKVPVFILGESMGGAIALRFTAMYPELVDGLISAVPSGDRFKQEKTELKVAMHMLKGPNKPMDIGTQVIEQATNDPDLAEAWSSDPLNRLELSPRELWQFQHFMNENHDSAIKITSKPVLVIQGFKDKLVKPKGTIDLFNSMPTAEKLLVVVGDREHLMFEEKQFTEEIVWVVLGWLQAHSGKSSDSATAFKL